MVVVLFTVIVINVFTYVRITFPVHYIDSSEYLRDIYRIHLLNETLIALHKELEAVVPSINSSPHSQPLTDATSTHGIAVSVQLNRTIDIGSSDSSIPVAVVSTQLSVPVKRKSAVLFTMDSIYSYEQNSLAGGASGTFVCCPLHTYSSCTSMMLLSEHILLQGS